jgi:ACS family hexuronate transporter-like MFS transporter
VIAAHSRPRTIPHLRWWIAGLLFLASVLNYIDRQTFSLLAPTIQADLKLNDAQYADIVSIFLAAYAVAYLLTGRVVDALGTRASLALFVGWWSVANACTGFARSAFSLGTCRFFLGLGEAGGYTASPKVVAEWFPAKDRGVAVGLYSLGGAVGATIAPILVITLAARYGWRSAFVATGLLGLVFVALWLAFYRRPEDHPRLSAEERQLILADRAPALAVDSAPVPQSERARWTAIFASSTVWALMGARLLTDPVWYFFQFWMPKYLHSARGFTQAELTGMWVIFLAADIGFLGSGFISGAWIRRGMAAPAARLRLMAVCAALVPCAALIAWLPSTGAVLAVAMLVVFAHTAWLASISTYVVDLVPAPVLGTAFGFIAAGSAIGGIVMNQAVAWTVARHGYDRCFYAMVVLHPLAFALLWKFARRPWRAAA